MHLKQFIIYTIVLFFIHSSINAEIKQVLDNFPPMTRGEYTIERDIIGTFEFVELPEPLKVATINYNLEITRLYPNNSDLDFTLKLPQSDNNITMLSDSIVTWKGPHKIGDIYTGTIEFIPLSSGKHSLTLTVYEVLNDFKIEWIFDEHQNLLALDNQHLRIKEFDVLQTYFFDNDSIFIFNNREKNKAFQYELTINPILKIGDTSSVHVRLHANRDFQNGIDIELSGSGVNIIKYPDIVNYPVLKDQKIEINFDIVPDSCNFWNGFGIYTYKDISNKLSYENNFDIGISFIFNEDGSLRFILDQPFGMNKAKEYYLLNFKNPQDVGNNTVQILKNGKIIMVE